MIIKIILVVLGCVIEAITAFYPPFSGDKGIALGLVFIGASMLPWKD